MQSFLFVAGVSAQVEPYLQALASSATPLLPRSTEARSAAVRVLPEIGGGWIGWTSAAAPAPLVTEHVAGELAVLCFGELAEGTPAARRVAEAYQEAGVARVRGLNGTFCAVIVERGAARIQVLTDRVGRLTASCWLDAGRLHVAVHEVLLGVCGCPFALDAVSAASVVGCGWSLSGLPLNRNVTRIDGRRRLEWTREQSRLLALPLFGPAAARVASGDERALRDVVGSMCEVVTRAARALAQTTTEVEAGLTAGLDSRAVLGALLSGFRREQLRLYTTGSRASRDMRVATQLASYLGVRHEQRPFEVPSSDAFQAHDAVRAFLANGDTSSRGSLAPLPSPRGPGQVIAGGGGGEIFRGYYYRIAGDAAGTQQVVRRLIARKFVRLEGVGMRGALTSEVTQRLTECFDSYATLSPVREDWLDLFYLHERFAHFAAPSARKQDARRWLPFADADLLELAWRLPAPLGAHCDVHRQLIRRFLPARLYWTPLNGRHPPALEGTGRVQKLLRDATFVFGYARKRLSRLRREDTSSGPTAESLFATAVYDYVASLLRSGGSVALAVFEEPRLSQLLERHRRRQDQLEALGPLVNMEHFRQLCERAYESRVRL